MKIKRLFCCGAAMFLATTNADALTINLIPRGDIAGSDIERGMKTAALYWSSILTNDATINLGVSYSYSYLGGEDPVYRTYSVQDWERQIGLTRSGSTLDQAAILPTLNAQGGATFLTDATTPDGRIDTAKAVLVDGDTVSSRMRKANTSVLKAIGGIDAHDQAIDGELQFAASPDLWDFDPTDGIDQMLVDFLATAIHEIGHALGFVSGVDLLDPAGDPNAPDGITYDLSGTPTFTALDMFRYSNDPSLVVPGDQPMLDLSVGTASYFSIDGGETQVFGDSGFSTGEYNGTGQQASHWRLVTDASDPCNQQIGMMAPVICQGHGRTVTALDLAAFDAMGWNTRFDVLMNPGYRASSADIYRQFQSAVPEPESWAMMLAGFAMIGGALRGRRTRPSVRIDLAAPSKAG